MAFTYTTRQGDVLIIPDTAVNVEVSTTPIGVALTGVIALVGEAEEGPAWNDADEDKLSNNSFGPNDLSRVVSKYGSGRLVDAYRGAIAPSSSPRIQGAPNRIILVKVNNGSRAAANTADAHGEFVAKRAGEAGNLIYFKISDSTAESTPTTGSFSYVPSASASAMSVRVNGAAKQSIAISADQTPDSLASALVQADGLNAVGGVDKSIVAGLAGQNISLTATGQNVSIVLALGQVFPTAPAIGDTVRIATGSVIAGAGDANVGWYLVTAISNTVALAGITAKKITAGAPVTVMPVALSGTPANDIVGYSSMRIDNMSGADREVLSGLLGTDITISASGSSMTATLDAGSVFASAPVKGDIVYIPAGSPYQGAGSANVGWYQITSTSNTTSSAYITAARLSNGAPVAVAAAAIADEASDLQVLDRQIKGAGKALEIADDGGAANINTIMKVLGADSAASFISTDSAEVVQTSSAELKKTISMVRGSSQESYTVGGNVALKIGYRGITAAATIQVVSGVRRLQTSVTGGAGANLDIDLSKIPTLNDLVAIIKSNAGYSASVASAMEGQKSPSVLDQVSSIGIASDLDSQPGRIKRDIHDLTLGAGSTVSSQLAAYVPSELAGLPAAQDATFLAGGAKGASTGLDWSDAIDALKAVRCNFVVPLASQDAADDIAEGKTDASSTYTVDAINALVKSHCLEMSKAKIKRHRVAVVSKRASFSDARLAAQDMANFRVAMLFQDVLTINSKGEIEQFQPWMGAAKAAGMQAAGQYKTIFNKNVNISGAVQAAGDFDDENLTQCEDAILAGLIPIQRQENGGYNFLTDQTTYGVDNNFVYNSLQAVYVADLMALSLAESLKKAFVGESTADVSAALAVAFIKAKMAEFLNLKWTTATAGAPGGYKSIDVQINEGIMAVQVTVVESTGIYFIPIDLTIEGVKSSASS